MSSKNNEVNIKSSIKTINKIFFIKKYIRSRYNYKIQKFFEVGLPNFTIYFLRKLITNNSFNKFKFLNLAKEISKLFFYSFRRTCIKKETPKKKLMFYFTGQKFYQSQINIINILSSNFEIIILSQINLKNKIQNKNIKYFNIKDFVTLKIFFLIFYKFLIDIGIFFNRSSNKYYSIFYTWLKINYFKLISYEKISDIIINRIKPHAIIISDPQEIFAQFLNFSGERMKINVIFIQFGLLTPETLEWVGQKTKQCLVFDEFSKKVISNNAKFFKIKKKISIFGNPKFLDLKFDYQKIKLKKMKIIFFCPVPKIFNIQNIETNIDLKKLKIILLNLNEVGKKLNLIIKLKRHPEDKYNYENFILENKLNNIRFSFFSIVKTEKLIEKYDVVISTHSAAAYESILLNKLTFLINIDQNQLTPFLDNNIGIIVNKVDQIYTYLKEKNINSVQKKFIKTRKDYINKNFKLLDKSKILNNLFKN